MLQKALLYARTARSLRWQQIVHRLLPRVSVRRGAPTSGALNERALERFRERIASWGPWDLASQMARARDVVDGRFSFLGVTRELTPVDWTSRQVSHLWSYNLHYFDYAVDLAWAARETGDTSFGETFTSLARSWIRETNGKGDGWHPYVVSARIVNWAQALALLGDRLDAADRRAIAESLHRQACWLARNLELHLQGNHLQRNLSALCTVGMLFSSESAVVHAAETTVPQLSRELFDQTSGDGGHAERSPMYLAQALYDFLVAAAAFEAAGRPVPNAVSVRMRAMGSALLRLSRANDTLHCFHDAADGSAPPPGWLVAAVNRTVGPVWKPTPGTWLLSDAGYCGYDSPDWTFIMDIGPPGPVHLPAHAHCSLLSFELDVQGAPLIVDSGVNGYAEDPRRGYFRGTSAHNTVVLNGRDQSELWSVFRMARRATSLAHAVRSDAEGKPRFVGSYAPFHDGSAVHERRVERTSLGWMVRDAITANVVRSIVSYLHFHPSWSVSATPQRIVAHRADRSVVITPFGISAARCVSGRESPPQGWYASKFGEATANTTVEMDVADARNFGFEITLSTSE